MTDINKQVAALLAFGFSRRDIAKIMSTSVHVVSLVARGERGVHGFDVYQLSQIDQLHRLVSPEAILREYDTNWIAFLDSRWEVFHPADGPPSVRLKVGAEP